MTTLNEICTKPDGTISDHTARRLRKLRYGGGGNLIRDMLQILNKISQNNLTLERTELGTDLLLNVRNTRTAITQLRETLSLIEFPDEDPDYDEFTEEDILF